MESRIKTEEFESLRGRLQVLFEIAYEERESIYVQLNKKESRIRDRFKSLAWKYLADKDKLKYDQVLLHVKTLLKF